MTLLTDGLESLSTLLNEPFMQILLTAFFVYLFCKEEIKSLFH